MRLQLLKNDASKVRPTGLGILCTITFVFGIFKIFLFLWAVLFYSSKINTGLLGLLDALLAIRTQFHALVWTGISMVSIVGAWLMWKLRKVGFYIYFTSAFIAYLLPAIIGGAEMMTIQRLFFTSVFIFFYGLHLKFLK
jgi:hypothetical protein